MNRVITQVRVSGEYEESKGTERAISEQKYRGRYYQKGGKDMRENAPQEKRPLGRPKMLKVGRYVPKE